ncbi:hypothetical protein FB451DRAFT_1562394 [Mycena latifolia]|nr:hypothetical protein FB451DRAFT_1562394 [Mycena latifolia]
MLYKLISSALLFLALAQVAVSVPSPVELECGGASDAPCPSGQLCCAKDGGNFCQAAALLCLVPTPIA